MILRRQLIKGVALAFALAGALAAAVGGIGMYEEISGLLDHQLVQVAELAAQITEPDADAAREAGRRLRRGHRDGEMIVQRWRGDQIDELLSTGRTLPHPTRAGFQTINIKDHGWRMYTLASEDGWIVVAQRADARHELLAGTVLTAILPVFLGLPLAVWLVVLVVRRALAPLRRLVFDLERLPAPSATALDTAGIPAEVRPLVDAFNNLLKRVSDGIDRERSFITHAAHALRTPVTALQLQADSLNEARTKADFRERMDDLTSGIARARRTVEQLLELARSEDAADHETSVKSVIESMPQSFGTVARSREVSLQLVDEGLGDAVVSLRQAALSAAVHNLLDNAFRYSPRGSTVTLGTARTGNDRCRVWVADEGPGLAPAELERVFDRFYRPVHDTTPGTGLGLAIVRAIAESIGGRAWLERHESAGVMAVMELPIRAQQPST
jgi:two-component system OmpR family sensor kinase